MKVQQIHFVVIGLVQGVGFRFATQRIARKLGLVGWVRNQLDGSVEAFAEGEPAQVEQLLEWSRTGPPQASVSEVRVIEKKEIPHVTSLDFEVRYNN